MRIEDLAQRQFKVLAVLQLAQARPYQLGVHDCFRVACQVVQALTGVDRWPQFAGYRSEREAKALLARHGRSFEAAFDWFFGRAHICTQQAIPGDICALETADGEKHLGVCLGADTVFLAPEGLVYVPTVTCLCCWKVG
jgi:hypothetical protein